jgi:hypothetical protein
MIKKAQINVDSAQTKHVADVLSRDVLQSFNSLKSADLVDYVQDEMIFNIHDVDDDWIIEIDVILQDKFETFRWFCVLLTKSAKFSEFFQNCFFYFVIESL